MNLFASKLGYKVYCVHRQTSLYEQLIAARREVAGAKAVIAVVEAQLVRAQTLAVALAMSACNLQPGASKKIAMVAKHRINELLAQQSGHCAIAAKCSQAKPSHQAAHA